MTPYSNAHKRVFDFSGLIPVYGLEFTERVATTFIAVAGNLVAARAELRRLMHFFTWLAALSGDDDGAADARRTAASILVSSSAWRCCTNRKPPTKKPKAGKKRGNPGFAIIEKLGQAGLFPPVQYHEKRRPAKTPDEESAPQPRRSAQHRRRSQEGSWRPPKPHRNTVTL